MYGAVGTEFLHISIDRLTEISRLDLLVLFTYQSANVLV